MPPRSVLPYGIQHLVLSNGSGSVHFLVGVGLGDGLLDVGGFEAGGLDVEAGGALVVPGLPDVDPPALVVG
jgi:hypothetical protein